MAKVLIVEDDAPLADGLAYNLERAGHEVLVARDGASGLELALTRRPDLVVLDLMLPALDGFGFLSKFRAAARDTPVIVLSALSDETTKIRGLDGGASDYVTKPFGVGELLARIRARLGGKPAAQAPIRVGEGEIDLERLEFRRGGHRVALTPTECSLVAELAKRPGAPVERAELLRTVWGVGPAATRTLDTHVARLRRKIEPDPSNPRHVITVHGVGLRLDP
jgi:DNA-binding response OmpR family regulator